MEPAQRGLFKESSWQTNSNHVSLLVLPFVHSYAACYVSKRWHIYYKLTCAQTPINALLTTPRTPSHRMPPSSPFPSKQKQNSPSQSTAMQIYGSWFKSMKRNAVWSRGRGGGRIWNKRLHSMGGEGRQTPGFLSGRQEFSPPGRASSQQIPTTQSPTGEGQRFPQARKPSPLWPSQAHLQNKDMRPPGNTLPQQHWFPPGGKSQNPTLLWRTSVPVHPWV